MAFKINWPQDPYHFLVSEKFGTFDGVDGIRAAMMGPNYPPIPEEKRDDAKAYRQELEKLPIQEINKLVQELFDRKNSELRDAALARDALSFFSQPHANANVNLWAGLEIWTQYEAAALAFGKDPNLVNPKSLLPYEKTSIFAGEYFTLARIIERDLFVEIQLNRLTPQRFLDWSKKTAVSIPDSLASAIRSRSGEPANSTDEAVEISLDNSVSTRERETLLYLIATMAVQKYGYTPKKRNYAAANIQRDMENTDLQPLSIETIRNKLKEACDHIPQRFFKNQNR